MSKRDDENAAFINSQAQTDAERQRREAQENQDRLIGRGGEVAGRGLFSANYAQADAARNQALQAGGEMQNASDLARTAAMGDPNSVAQQQLRSNLQTAQQNQQTAAAATHGGPLAAAAAQRQALVTGGNIAAGGVSQSALLGAQEQRMGRDAYGNATNSQNQFNQQMQGMDASRSMNDRDSQFNQEEQRRETQRQFEGQAGQRYGSENQRQTQQDEINRQRTKQDADRKAEERGRTLKDIGAGASAVAPFLGVLSDTRTKRSVPISEVAATMRRR